MSVAAGYWYEQPLNERIRTFLRVEHLTARLRHHTADDSLWGRRAAMDSVLDLLNVMSRHDIRGEVSRALVQRRATLAALGEREDVDRQALDRILAEIDTISDDMARIPPQFAAYLLRDHDLLASVNNRSAIPGGTCSFDLPAYRQWLAGSTTEIQHDLSHWTERVTPIEHGVALLLRLLRDSGERLTPTARGGMYLHQTAPGVQLIRVQAQRLDVFPEISAGRHRATVRFMRLSGERAAARQSDEDITFSMVCCRL